MKKAASYKRQIDLKMGLLKIINWREQQFHLTTFYLTEPGR